MELPLLQSAYGGPAYCYRPHAAMCPLVCGTPHCMVETTLYLRDELKAALEQAAAETGRSPTSGIRVSDDPHFAERADEYLAAFGAR